LDDIEGVLARRRVAGDAHGVGAANNAYGYGTRSFAGGTGDGRNGVSAMELAPLQSTLTAKKAWFFFDDAIVFLTNSITSTSTNRVETIVNQVPTSSKLVQNGD
jgi:hyaluronate lyase